MASPPAATPPPPPPGAAPQPPQSGLLIMEDGKSKLLIKVKGPDLTTDAGRTIKAKQEELEKNNAVGMLAAAITTKRFMEGEIHVKPSHLKQGHLPPGTDIHQIKNARDLTRQLQIDQSGWTAEQVEAHTNMVMRNMVAHAAALTHSVAQPVLAGAPTSTAVSTPTNFTPPTTPVSGTKSETAVQKHVRSIVEQKGYKISTIEPLVKISGETGCYVTATKKTAKEERFFVPVELNTITASNPEEKTPNLISNSSLPDDVAQQFAGRALSAINPADVSALAQALDNKAYFSDVGSTPNEYKIWFQHTEGRIILVPCPDGRADYENAKSYVIADAKGPLTGYNLVKAALKFIEVRPNIITGVASLTIAKDTSTYSYTISTSSGITLALHSEGPELRTSSSTSKKQETISKQRRQIEFTKFENIDNMEPGKLHKYLKGSKDPRVHSEVNVGHFTAGGEADLAHNPDPTATAGAQDYIVTEDGQFYGDVDGSDSDDDDDGSRAGSTDLGEE